MTIKQAVKILKHHNAWRTGEDDSIDMPNPKSLTKALNKAIEIMEKQS